MSGTVCIATITIGIKDPTKFRDTEILEGVLSTMIRASGLTKIGKEMIQPYMPKERLKPMGITILQCLKESHASLETYPEKGLVELLISSCKNFNLKQLPAMMEPYYWACIVDQTFFRRVDGRWITSEV